MDTAGIRRPCTLYDIFTIDVEDWFHILETEGTPEVSSWDALPSRLERNLEKLMEILDTAQVKATLFTLGWAARRIPRLLRQIADLGHEPACHGDAHQVVHALSERQFRQDIRRAKATIEDTTGRAVRGYRAPGFSVTHRTPWVFTEIVEAGFEYDSSVFPGRHSHGGIPNAPRSPWIMNCHAGSLVEFPVTVADTFLGPQCFFGGGYLRLFPLKVVQIMAERVRRDGRAVVWYIHPREIDRDHPRIAMPLKRRFKSYVNLGATATKLSAVLQSGSFATMGEVAAQYIESASLGQSQ